MHGIRKTTTAGYDPSANGAGESAIGFIKRRSRQLLVGSALSTKWWGMSTLAAASYSRCGAEFDNWPSLPFGTRVMHVHDPPERNSFLPRSLPATIFGPAEKVPGGYYAFQRGVIKEAVNVKWAPLCAEELAYVKASVGNWAEPDAPCKPADDDTWNAAALTGDTKPD